MGTEADLIKQTCWAEAEAAKVGKIIGTTKGYGIIGEPLLTACIVSVKMKIIATLRKACKYIYSKQNIVENSEVLRLLIESTGENLPLNECSKTFMLQIGNK